MPATLSSLIAHPDFGVSARVAAAATVALGWVHSSDLADPAPFLAPGQVLLTTGRQFPDGDDLSFYSAYVDRLRTAGVVALGFGTEVVRAGTPEGLIEACRRAGLPLVEVPYRTPFIAISQWVAGVQASEATARIDWVVATQNAVSVAALGAGGIGAAIRRTAGLLGCSIDLFDADGDLTESAAESASPALPPAVLAEKNRLLRAQRRARSDLTAPPGWATIQTLGTSRQLSGALVLTRAEPFDSADFSVATTLVALAEVSLEHRHSLRVSLRSLMEQLFALLRAGRVAEVRNAIQAIPAGLPGTELMVVSIVLAADDAALRDALERRAAVPENHTFVVSLANTPDRLTLLTEPREWPGLAAFLTRRNTRAGVSEGLGWDRLDVGIVQAERALERARPGVLVAFSELVSSSLFGLLASARVAEIAHARLSSVLVLPDGRALLTDASVWLRHNASWDPAARELGIHRHTLKARMHQLGVATGLDLEEFPDRAELWALLASLDLAST